jgi:YjbE family integral membrane protein
MDTELHALELIPAVVEIVFIDLVLSGDNAVLIALATRSLRPDLRAIGILVGTSASIIMRVVATAAVGLLLMIPFLKLLAAVALLYIAVKLVLPDDDRGRPEVASHGEMWAAVRLVAVADFAMSLDNVVAVAGVADGSVMLMVFGLLVSMPLLMFGNTLVANLIGRFTMLVPLCGGLLGWIAGGIAVSDPLLQASVVERAPAFVVIAPFGGAVFVMMLGRILDQRRLDRRTRAAEDQLPAN